MELTAVLKALSNAARMHSSTSTEVVALRAAAGLSIFDDFTFHYLCSNPADELLPPKEFQQLPLDIQRTLLEIGMYTTRDPRRLRAYAEFLFTSSWPSSRRYAQALIDEAARREDPNSPMPSPAATRGTSEDKLAMGINDVASAYEAVSHWRAGAKIGNCNQNWRHRMGRAKALLQMMFARFVFVETDPLLLRNALHDVADGYELHPLLAIATWERQLTIGERHREDIRAYASYLRGLVEWDPYAASLEEEAESKI